MATDRRTLAATVLVLVAAACSGPDPGADAPASPATATEARFGDATQAGLCQDVTVEWAEDEPGYATPEQAVAAFVDETPELAVTEVVDRSIRFGGEEVGEVEVEPAPAGGHFVGWAWWCYPEEDAR